MPYLAKLSALKVDDSLAKSVEEVIEVLHQLSQVEDKDMIEEAESAISLTREDNIEPSPSPQILLSNAHKKEYHMFCVPKVIG